MRSLLLSNWSSWHRAASATQWKEFDGNHESSTSPGESSARLPAGLRRHRHLWRCRQSTWSAQKGTERIKGWQSVAAPVASHFCKSDHLQLSISHFWPFIVANCCQRNSCDNGIKIRKKNKPKEYPQQHGAQRALPQKTEETTKLRQTLVGPWLDSGGILHGRTLVEPLVEPSTKPFSSSKRTRARKPERLRNLGDPW